MTRNKDFCWDECLQKMITSLFHRGPDDEGTWIDRKYGIALGHRRLSILDLSSAGHQPMHSKSGRYVIVFNGEIYNHKQIREELEELSGCQWAGHSDTEVILSSVEEWGLEGALKRFIGMFAIALWDRKEHVLTIVRDRLGEKPLYYGWIGNTFLFASELKAFRAYPHWQRVINRDALNLFMRYNYVPAPYSIYKGIYKLLPGTIAKVRISDKNVVPVSYWSAKEVAEFGIAHPFVGNETEAIEQLDGLLRSAIARQMIADVPVGAFLSGGIDSSTVVALMQVQSNKPVKTFTIGFNESGYNEAEYAKRVARHLGTEHTELYISPKEAMAVIPKLPTLYDEPFSDSSQIPIFLISQMARQHVAVILTGDGGDELFGGYNRYFLWPKIWNIIKIIPRTLRSLFSKVITTVSPHRIDYITEVFLSVIHNGLKAGRTGDKLHKLAEIINKDSTESLSLYKEILSTWKSPSLVVLDSQEPSTIVTDKSQWADLDDFILQMMYLDTITYLSDDILVKVDRAAMGVSLETRVPFLDHNVFEFAWKLPLSLKIRGGQGKWILKQVLYKYVPKELIERPKMGFGVPIDCWLRGPLRSWSESLLDESRLRREGFFNPEPIRKKWAEHLSCQRNWQNHIWNVLMFQSWLDFNNA